jgi:predicted AlkP superfamily phosphohydrolase/phosphomutase
MVPDKFNSKALRRNLAVSIAALAASAIVAPAAHAYIGPGAGFAFVGSFAVMFLAVFAAALVILMWPIRIVIIALRRKSGYKKTDVGRAVVVGLDGIDPRLTRKWMDEGLLPNFSKLADKGSFGPLGTTCPSISPVAWSSFTTGLTPARHGIFDFLDRDLKTYLPVLSSARIGGVEKSFRLGKYIIPLKSPHYKLLRKGTPFWHTLADKGISCSILRVPITFPPEKFDGRVLSAMCTPDLRGTQGTFSFYTTDKDLVDRKESGQVFNIELDGDTVKTHLVGPHNTFLEDGPISECPVTVKLDRDRRTATFSLPDETFTIPEGIYSDWISVGFKMMPGITAKGICRFLITNFEPFSFYVTPINIDPAEPALPISHPKTFSAYYGKLIGPHATLGLAEDTWALNEQVIDDAQFKEQMYMIHDEREAMLMNELDNVKKGLVVCVFDITDRAQHMFWKHTDPGHPALGGKEPGEFKDAIRDVYVKMDEMVGRVMERQSEKDVLVVMSDHGFGPFRRGVNLNSWLYEQGYLKLKNGKGPSDEEWFRNVDWKSTVAYGVGLGGICINIKGRESKGIIPKGRLVDEIKAGIIQKLAGLVDEENGAVAISNVYDMKAIYSGPYLEHGPELVVGFAEGYRVSWECAKGVVDGVVFKDNVKSWSGDHCIDYASIPGVMLTNMKLNADDPNIIDIGPTLIKAFGIDIPRQMEGKALI